MIYSKSPPTKKRIKEIRKVHMGTCFGVFDTCDLTDTGGREYQFLSRGIDTKGMVMMTILGHDWDIKREVLFTENAFHYVGELLDYIEHLESKGQVNSRDE